LLAIVEGILQQKGSQADGCNHNHGERATKRAGLGIDNDQGQQTAQHPGPDDRPAPGTCSRVVDVRFRHDCLL